ncbi:MAG: tyrosine-type recombinase/integrase [Rubripirellula sp.]
MPSSSGSVPKYRKHSSGQARVTINGRDYYLGPWQSCASIRQYDQVIAEFLASGRSGSFGLQDDCLTVAMLMSDYLKFARGYYGTGTTSDWHRIKLALRPLKHLYASDNAHEFGPTRFKATRQRMESDGLTRSGINSRMKRIVRMFKWAASEGKVPPSVYETLRLIPSLKLGRTDAPEAKPISPVEESTVITTLPMLSPVVADMVRVQLLTGCRPGEVCRLTPGNIDRSTDVWEAKLENHKTAHHGHERTIVIGPQAQQILAPYLSRADDSCLFQPIDAVEARRKARAASRTTPPSCGNRVGRKYDRGGLKGKNAKKTPGTSYTTESYRRAIHYGCDKAFPAPSNLSKEGLAAWRSEHRWSPNRLRHTRGTDIRKRFGLEAAQVILGHKKADVTQIYAERDRDMAIEVAREVG